MAEYRTRTLAGVALAVVIAFGVGAAVYYYLPSQPSTSATATNVTTTSNGFSSSSYTRTSTSTSSSGSTTASYSVPPGSYQPNVFVLCHKGTYLSDHKCSSFCPSGFKPVNMTNDLAVYSDSSPVCLENGTPVSINDLAGLQISANNGSTVYLVVSNIPMDKVNITGEDYNTNIWLPVSSTVIENITAVPSIPNQTIQVAAVGDTVSTFRILQINETSILGNVTQEYPLCCTYSTQIIHVGDDIGVQCLGISEILNYIDYQHGIAVFTRIVSQPPPVGCPI